MAHWVAVAEPLRLSPEFGFVRRPGRGPFVLAEPELPRRSTDLTLPVAGVFKGARNPLDVSSLRSPTDKLRPHHSWATDELICAGERHLHRLPADYTCI